MIPYINKEQSRKLDELMVHHFNINILMMMELAGYRIAEFIREKYPNKKNILIASGKGNNGGDGLAAARHLKNFGFVPKVFLIIENLKAEPEMQKKALEKIDIEFIDDDQFESILNDCDIVIDCLIGYNLNGEPHGKIKETIKTINKVRSSNFHLRVVSCDIPSGIDTDKGKIFEQHIKADDILFLSLPKIGCKNLDAEKFTADIGVPSELYELIGVETNNYFNEKNIIKN